MSLMGIVEVFISVTLGASEENLYLKIIDLYRYSLFSNTLWLSL